MKSFVISFSRRMLEDRFCIRIHHKRLKESSMKRGCRNVSRQPEKNTRGTGVFLVYENH
ncbi:hypothetical protein [Halobacillus litoralis]|uniref:hypothetical protein n=1 Tax=Halobacillus litoralis TaxID=45668 RepID=UPI00136D2938|nr:hypothetical protein [Halobacillus litoralis]MYL38577.1 hypothetical protein [Halobacillus litoralis]